MKWAMRVGKCRAFTLVDLAVVLATVAMLLMLLPAMGRSKCNRSRVQCTSNLKQIGLAFRGFAQDWDGAYPMNAKYTTNYIGAPPEGTLVTGNTNPADLWMHFQMLSNELNTAKVLMCIMDRSRYNSVAEDFTPNAAPLGFANPAARNNALSYFYGVNADETKPEVVLAGDRNLASASSRAPYSSVTARGPVRVTTNSAWSTVSGSELHGDMVNIVMADGSVRRISKQDDLPGMLQLSERKHGSNANLILFPQ